MRSRQRKQTRNFKPRFAKTMGDDKKIESRKKRKKREIYFKAK